MSCSPVLRCIEQYPATARSPRHPWPDAIKPSGAAAPPTRGPVTPTGRTASSRGLPKDHPSTAPWPPHCSSPSQEYQPVRGSSPHRRPTSPADHRACLNPQPGARRIRRSGRFGRGGVLRSRPLVTGDSVAASHRAQPLPICSAGRITARSRRGVVAAGLVTLALPPGTNACGTAPRQRYRGDCSGEGNPEGHRRGNRNLGDGRRGRTGERRTTGNQGKAGDWGEPGGQTGNRRKARGEPEDVR